MKQVEQAFLDALWKHYKVSRSATSVVLCADVWRTLKRAEPAVMDALHRIPGHFKSALAAIVLRASTKIAFKTSVCWPKDEFDRIYPNRTSRISRAQGGNPRVYGYSFAFLKPRTAVARSEDQFRGGSEVLRARAAWDLAHGKTASVVVIPENDKDDCFANYSAQTLSRLADTVATDFHAAQDELAGDHAILHAAVTAFVQSAPVQISGDAAGRDDFFRARDALATQIYDCMDVIVAASKDNAAKYAALVSAWNDMDTGPDQLQAASKTKKFALFDALAANPARVAVPDAVATIVHSLGVGRLHNVEKLAAILQSDVHTKTIADEADALRDLATDAEPGQLLLGTKWPADDEVECDRPTKIAHM